MKGEKFSTVNEYDGRIETLKAQTRNALWLIEQARQAYDQAIVRRDEAGMHEHGRRLDAEEASRIQLVSELASLESERQELWLNEMAEEFKRLTPAKQEEWRRKLGF